MAIFQEIADQRGMAETLGLLGLVSYGTGDLIQGAVYYTQAIPLLRASDNRPDLVHALAYLSLRARYNIEVLGRISFSQLAEQTEMAL